MTIHERLLIYLLKILGSPGRQALKDHLMQEDHDLPRQLLNEINKLERVLGKIERQDREAV